MMLIQWLWRFIVCLKGGSAFGPAKKCGATGGFPCGGGGVWFELLGSDWKSLTLDRMSWRALGGCISDGLQDDSVPLALRPIASLSHISNKHRDFAGTCSVRGRVSVSCIFVSDCEPLVHACLGRSGGVASDLIEHLRWQLYLLEYRMGLKKLSAEHNLVTHTCRVVTKLWQMLLRIMY
jgi:hypothetical protein